MDTQWPRWEVFEKERPDSPHRNVGSVHAPDAEMALENARDVFVRRPRCLNLWVVSASEIFTKTVQELGADSSWQSVSVDPNVAAEPYLVFQKQTQRAAETFVAHVGEVQARSPQDALSLALEKYSDDEAFVWWVCPARAVTGSDESDVDSMFAPSESKPYRQPQFYKVITRLQQIKSSKPNG